VEYAAVQGNVEACLLLSQSYEKGFNGVGKNDDLSVFWKRKADQKMK
jgi:TPR repeat protein